MELERIVIEDCISERVNLVTSNMLLVNIKRSHFNYIKRFEF